MKPLIVKDSLYCQWEGVVHEYITYHHAKSQDILPEVTYVFSSEGSRSKNPKKFEETAQILETALQKEPDNSRYAFYLAESYRDAELPKQALAAYEKRVEMGGWDEETFWSLLQIAHLKKSLGYLREEVLSSYLQAHQQSPFRSEPIYYLAELYNQNQDYELAYTCIKNWQFQPKPDRHGLLFYLGWTEDYGIHFQLSISAFYVHQY